jgi:hypothetical protein
MEHASQSSISAGDREEYRIFTVTNVQIYHSDFGRRPCDWKATGLMGTLVFGTPVSCIGSLPSDGRCWFRLFDVNDPNRLIWTYTLSPGFEYCLDKPFFHVFAGRVRRPTTCLRISNNFNPESHVGPPVLEPGRSGHSLPARQYAYR